VQKGENGLVLAISGFRIGLRGLDQKTESGVRERFGLFLQQGGSGPVPLDLEVRARPADVRQYLPYPAEDGHRIYRIESREADGRLHVWSYSFSGVLSLSGPEADIAICRSGFEPSTRSLENFLRVALAWKAAAQGALLLHSSGVVRDGLAYLFFGPSGAGKTTVTRHSREHLILNDDIILIRPAERQVLASGVPFKGSDDLGAEHTGAFPVAGLFRLVQADEDLCLPLPLGRAMSELAGAVPFVTDRAEGLMRVFAILEDIARRVPVHTLRFTNSADFWGPVLAAAGERA